MFTKIKQILIATPLLVLPQVLLSQAAASPAGTGCSLERQDHYRCDRQAFAARLARARTVRIDTDRMDLFAAQHVRDLVGDLGKQVAAPEQRPDLVFDLAPIDRTGRIDFGPADVALGTLKIYDPAKGSGARGLIWVETFDGQEDRPWPSVVVDVIRKFKDRALTQTVPPAS